MSRTVIVPPTGPCPAKDPSSRPSASRIVRARLKIEIDMIAMVTNAI